MEQVATISIGQTVFENPEVPVEWSRFGNEQAWLQG